MNHYGTGMRMRALCGANTDGSAFWEGVDCGVCQEMRSDVNRNQSRVRVVKVLDEEIREWLVGRFNLPLDVEVIATSPISMFTVNGTVYKLRHRDWEPVPGGQVIPELKPLQREGAK